MITKQVVCVFDRKDARGWHSSWTTSHPATLSLVRPPVNQPFKSLSSSQLKGYKLFNNKPSITLLFSWTSDSLGVYVVFKIMNSVIQHWFYWFMIAVTYEMHLKLYLGIYCLLILSHEGCLQQSFTSAVTKAPSTHHCWQERLAE